MPSYRYRAHQRYRVVLDVTVTSLERGTTARGKTTDLGLGGGAFEVDTPLRMGDAVEVFLRFSDNGHAHAITGVAQLRGRIAWVGWSELSSVRLGVSFTDTEVAELARVLDAHVLADDVGT